jgi:hypothetical protein
VHEALDPARTWLFWATVSSPPARPLTAISVERIVVTKKVQNLLVAGQDIQNIRWATEVIALVPPLSFDRAL